MAYDIGSMFSSSNSVENLVYQYMRFEQGPRNRILDRQDQLNGKKSILSKLDSKLSALYSSSDRLSDSVINYFDVNKASSSNEDYLTVSASSNASAGIFSVNINRLATADTRVSRQYDSGSNNFNNIASDQTFSISLAHPTSEDEENRVSVSVTIDADTFQGSSQEVLEEIMNQINSSINTAVVNDELEAEEKISASVVSESDGKSRLVLRSNQTGFNNRMIFSDSEDGILSTLGVLITNGKYDSDGHDYGYMTEVGTNDTDSGLNSIIEVDGLTYYRDENQITDAISGLTIDLISTTTSTQTITVENDDDSVRNEIQDFMNSYNEAISYLKEKSQINPDTLVRGELSGDYSYKALHSDLLSLPLNSIDSPSSAEYSSLYSIGIGFSDDGRMTFTDEDKFNEALSISTKLVSDIFNASDGIATVINEKVKNFTESGGVISSSKSTIDSNLLYLSRSLKRVEDQLAAKEKRYRDEFARLQQTMSALNDQMGSLSMFTGGYY
jgi:flagellar hook-associated protein 2